MVNAKIVKHVRVTKKFISLSVFKSDLRFYCYNALTDDKITCLSAFVGSAACAQSARINLLLLPVGTNFIIIYGSDMVSSEKNNTSFGHKR